MHAICPQYTLDKSSILKHKKKEVKILETKLHGLSRSSLGQGKINQINPKLYRVEAKLTESGK
jgi:hypothetical protein